MGLFDEIEPLRQQEDLFSSAGSLAVDVNLYRNGSDSTGRHRDRFSCRRPECIVPVLTLGATRRFQLKPRAGGASLSFSPNSGDLIVMGGRCQQDWVHGVPKLPEVLEPRISVNFQSSTQAGRQRKLAER